MSDEFLKLSVDQKRSILEGAESQTGIKPSLLEKDIWICWILSKLFTLPIRMAFKGGTSLSKCYGLIDRFSEDVDVTIDYRDLMADLDITKESNSQLKKKRLALKVKVENYIIETVIPMLEQVFSEEFNNEKIHIEFEDGEKLYFNYPSVLEKNSDIYVAENVLIEFGGTNKTEPNEIIVVKPYLTASSLVLPNANVQAYSPSRTFWEKATLIHVECHKGKIIENPDRKSRHWHDLAKLSQSWVKEKSLQDKELLNDALRIKKAFFNASYANYEKCEHNEFVLIPSSEEIKQLHSDYVAMVKSGMFMNNPQPFNQIIDQLQQLQNEINQN